MSRWSYRAKALCFGTDDVDARGRRSPPEDVVEVLLFMSEFRVKTQVRLDSAAATLCAVTLLRALSWSSGVVGHGVEFKHPGVHVRLRSRVGSPLAFSV